MKKSDTPSEPISKKTSPIGFLIYRYSVIVSAALTILSFASDLGTRISNKIWLRNEEIKAAATGKDLIPYESPSFHLLKGVVVNEALASPLR